ncbi:hypothetical protein BH10PSE12_BH10PSE12_37650 [soil metagenome]
MVSPLSRSTRRLAGLRMALAMLSTAVPWPVRAACDTLLPPARAGEGPQRAMTTHDLVTLRDIGSPDSSFVNQPSPLAISPDGGGAAFIISRADPGTNSYCLGVVMIRLDGPAAPVLLDQGGEVMLTGPAGADLVKPVGATTFPAPRWSPDGRWIAYLRRDKGRTQLWRVSARGGPARPVTHSLVDVEDFAWAGGSHRLLIATRPGFARFEEQSAMEGLGGWRYDDRFVPYLGRRPRPRGDLPFTLAIIDGDSGAITQADTAERDLLDLTPEELRLPFARARDGRRAWVERRGDTPSSPMQLRATDRQGRTMLCTDPRCAKGITGVWWDAAGQEVRFLRREGWADKDHMALYRWVPGHRPKPVLRTQDLLIGCAARQEDLVCLRENSATPRHIIRLDPATGRASPVFEPNTEFARIARGPIERLRWRNANGGEAWGDLVLPPGYRTGDKLPLVIVQYHSDGFLRGGTGDEYPIPVFAAQGFAVLSIELAPWVGAKDAHVKSWEALRTAGMQRWAERWNQLSSLQAGIAMAIARGVVDPKRIGITGLSDGASTARFALINAPIFTAAAISSCCVDPVNVMTLAGTDFADNYRKRGAPSLTHPDNAYWQAASLTLNARRLDRPLLMQIADDEVLLALESYTALRDYGQPVEMAVFPDEHHIKWQPAHRAAIYARNLDWFAYWLQNRKDPDPAKIAQYGRWDGMRAGLETKPPERAAAE